MVQVQCMSMSLEVLEVDQGEDQIVDVQGRCCFMGHEEGDEMTGGGK